MKEITLTRGLVCIVDENDFAALSKYRWSAAGRNYIYATRWNGGVRQLMHREIMGVTDPKIFVDHINGCTLDNRRQNLRICTRSQNCQNRKPESTNICKAKGVFLTKHGTYTAAICVESERIHLGTFDTIADAKRHYNSAAIIHHGEYANLHTDVVPMFAEKRYSFPVKSTSGYLGVCKDGKKWRARIRIGNGNFSIGRYSTPEEAARAYDQKSIELNGAKAKLNFPSQ